MANYADEAEAFRLEAEVLESRGACFRDCALIARSAEIGIWHTEKMADNDCPHSLHSLVDQDPLYRGFAQEELQRVIETGLDVPQQAAFFASSQPDKAWEYPSGRQMPAILILSRSRTERSFVTRPADAGDTWLPDKARYPNAYTAGAREIHTRFELGRGTHCFFDEDMYGYWIPEDARDALLGIVIGGPKSDVVELLKGLPLTSSYCLSFAP
ncbi:hypothetical protein [Mycobacteroides abscessus]|uniref:hypothetical protein n=1 Tax=Mycobacteroides abscessus TaxID=36809 RepID=UPI0009A83F4D|nr:hypothetical protein [Mycobacteroides abscessus]SKS49974.1 Uncharacterised protein [Mycobacteroides abscessus subsp. bolletii]SLE12595.1 Uncharacterised protein [Mycobacteroides abscessus subsp. bolletii]